MVLPCQKHVGLDPFIISEVKEKNKIFRLKKPLFLTPFLNEEGTFLCLVDETLGIDIYGQDREDLYRELCEHLEFLWRVYAQGDESRMTDKAIALRKNLRDAIELEILDAQR